MSDAVLTRDGPVSVPLDYQVPASGELLPRTVRATIDGTSAAGPFYAAVQIVAPSGRIMGSYISAALAAGASADVTWFRGIVPIPSSSAVLPGTGLDRHVTGQTIANNTGSSCSFDSVLFDDLGWFNPASPTLITVNLSGQYLCIYTNSWNYPAGGGFAIQTGIDYNLGTRVIVQEEIVAIANTPNTTSGSGVVNANAGDTFRLRLYQISGGNMTTWIAGDQGSDVQSFPTLTVIRIGDRV